MTQPCAMRIETALGPICVGATASGLALVELDARNEERLQQRLSELTEASSTPHDEQEARAHLERAASQIAEYARKERRAFDLALDLRGERFAQEVWQALCRIPFGATQSYGEIARRIGTVGAARSVGRACGANPVPIVVPCHRVVASTGLGGFSGGIAWKRRLLELEGVLLFS
jgi:O-6-methylguanine DNA methyltransferase